MEAKNIQNNNIKKKLYTQTHINLQCKQKQNSRSGIELYLQHTHKTCKEKLGQILK